MKRRLDNLKNNPEFQEKLQNIKPKRNIWGVLGVVLFFFVPEYLNVMYHQEINAWIAEYAKNYPIEEMREMIVTLSSKAFDGKISFLNIGLGIAFLVWIFWDDIRSMLKFKRS